MSLFVRNLISQPRFKMSEGKNIPRLRFPEFYGSWEKKKLEDVGKIRMCKRIFNHQTSVSGDIPFYKIGTFGKEPDSYISKELYHEFKHKYSYPKVGDILISAAGTLGRTVVFDGSPSYFQDSNIVWIDNKENLITNQFLYYIYKIVRYESEGGTIQRLYNSIIYNAKFWKPSLPEQQKIVDSLTAVDKRIELLEKKKTLLETYKKGVMKKIFNQEIRFKDDNGNDFPDWEEKKVMEICEVKVGGTPSTSKPEYWDGDIPWINSGEIKDGIIIEPSRYISDLGLKKTSTYLLPKGTSVLAMTGATLGKMGLLSFSSTANQSVAGFVTDSITSKFIFYNFIHDQKQILSKAGGAAQKGVNKNTIENFDIRIPSIEEQLKISEFLSAIDNQIELLESQINKSKDWKKGLLQKMFV